MLSLSPCNLCPRECGVDRVNALGFCHCGRGIKAARAALHFGEEPCISGKNGSGAVFFSGCILRCSFCQNRDISFEGIGKEISALRLSEIFLELQEKGAHNINLVTADQYLIQVIEALDIVKAKLKIPVIYNCGGYEKIEALRALKSYVDVFLPDLKYFDKGLSQKYSGAADYFELASKAVKEMTEQAGEPEYNKDGIMTKGVIIRHLVLPGQRKDSFRVLKWIKENLPEGKYLISLMSQFTPINISERYKELNRRVTAFEYKSVVKEALRLGLNNGYMQEQSSAVSGHIPLFNMEGI